MKVPQLLSVILIPVLAGAACNTNESSDSATSLGGRNSETTAKPVSLTGCLQNGDGGSFIVTTANDVSNQATGTTGEAVQSEQQRQAARAYRIEPKDSIDLESMVGKQVSVTGTIEEQADLPRATTGNGKPDDIKADDLARVEATSVTVIADTCK